MATDTTILIPFMVDDVQIVAAAFREAAARPRTDLDQDALTRTGESSFAPMAVRWADIANGTAACCSVINFDGEQMFAVRQNLSEWGLVCAQLTQYATRRYRSADPNTLEGEEDMLRAEYALDLMTRISEAIGDQ